MMSWETCSAVERNPRKISGAWAFTGTRVPVYALFENLESGATVKQFLEWYPGAPPKPSPGSSDLTTEGAWRDHRHLRTGP